MKSSLRYLCVLCVSVVYSTFTKLTTEAQRTQRKHREKPIIALLLTAFLLFQATPPAKACGPETIEPIFVFTGSPDIPFDEFTKGKIGILQSTFGRKTLVIAHRYLSGGTFTEDEQHALVDALKGKAPEEEDGATIKAWIEARKLVLPDEKESPAIYDERRYTRYDFFPNCTKNAFEVATQTLKDRIASYGAEDANVRDWLQAQDVVFKNCAEGAMSPSAVGAGSPKWLQKDRDYQTAAAYFYSLNYAEARSLFQKIADDSESDWQETAAYLVARTLVRQASLSAQAKEKKALYEQAETQLINLSARGAKFQNASKRLLGLVKYRLHPEERVRELAQTLDEQSGNENLRQDLIDYNWLLDKFDLQVQKEEEERKKALNPSPSPEVAAKRNDEYEARHEAIQRGDLIDLYFTPKDSEGKPAYNSGISLDLKPNVTETEVFQEVEIRLSRKLTPEEAKELKDAYVNALSHRQWVLSPNRKFDSGSEYDGCEFGCNDLALELYPPFLRADELTDWILTFQSKDPKAFAHSVTRWRKTQSNAWLAIALTKSTRTSRGLARLLADAERVENESPAYATIAYHLIRLRLELNRPADAAKLLETILATKLQQLPISSQNLFLAQRLKLASTVDEFLRFAARQPVAFSEYGVVGRITDLLRAEKDRWDAEYYVESKDEWERKTEESFKQFLPWDERRAFDPDSADLFNWHFSIAALLNASRSQELPDYLKRSLTLAVWTRAILLKNDAVARGVAQDVARLIPEMSPDMEKYLNASSRLQRDDEALYILLKFPNLSPYVPPGVPEFSTSEESEYYFETSWWCKPDETEYHMDGTESPKVVASPRFLSARVLAIAKKERDGLAAIGDAKSFLGKRVLEWAKRSPGDPRMPEAIYIAVQANQSYKYGCGSWEEDEETRIKLETLLKERYGHSPWAAKLETP